MQRETMRVGQKHSPQGEGGAWLVSVCHKCNHRFCSNMSPVTCKAGPQCHHYGALHTFLLRTPPKRTALQSGSFKLHRHHQASIRNEHFAWHSTTKCQPGTTCAHAPGQGILVPLTPQTNQQAASQQQICQPPQQDCTTVSAQHLTRATCVWEGPRVSICDPQQHLLQQFPATPAAETASRVRNVTKQLNQLTKHF